ncbi:MAG: DUF1772 domain-containing protein [Cyanothece sp. SIO1E1]|nr:DUF1772 domain-containing protein [Cyanothece sp. SIO1E1]
MELSIHSMTLFVTVILTGLSAGFFFAWQVTVIPGTLKVSDSTYLKTMQSINKEILNPLFFLIFFGSLITLIASTVMNYGNGATFWLILASMLVYLFGTFFVTSAGNVPLNNQLEALNLSQLSAMQLTEFRAMYEPKWNVLHTVRTFFSVVSFILILLAQSPFKG